MVSLIVAMAENRVIGRNNSLPWRLPNDLKHFKRLTVGHPIIMGRKNHESIGRPLPDRTNIVITRSPDYRAPGCIVVNSVESAFDAASNDPEIFVIGGAEIYAHTLGRARRLYMTLVHADIPGDTYFPGFNAAEWRETSRMAHQPDAEHKYAYTFLSLDRVT